MKEIQKDIIDLLYEASKIIDNDEWEVRCKDLLKRLPANLNSSQEVYDLISELYDLQGKAIISGQHDYLESPFTYSSYISSVTGKNPRIKGVELGGISGQNATILYDQRKSVVNACKGWHGKGGNITATYHAVFPGTTNTWSNVQKYCTDEQFEQIITPGTELYNLFILDIDNVAEHLKVLCDANIPVLWRPYHEMNGEWFWWGKKKKFKALWDIMYDRYTNYHKLNNLIWVWCPNANNQWTDSAANYYVGHDKADVVGMDIYDNDYKPSNHTELLRIGGGKLMCIGECGQNPDPLKTRLRQSMFSWFMTWGNYATDAKINPVTKTFLLYYDPYVLSRNEVYNPEVIHMPDTSVGNGLWGAYYVGKNFETFNQGKVIPKVDFNWTNGTTVGNYNMSVKWTGYIRPRYTEYYTLSVNSSDGTRLTLDGQVIINDWTVHQAREPYALVKLEADKYYYVELEYFNSGDSNAEVHLFWSSLSQTKEVIPQSRLYVS